MHSYEAQMIDLALSQAIDRYRDMTSEEVKAAIIEEWPEQIRALLMEFLFKTTCSNLESMTVLFEIPRKEDGVSYFMAICACDFNEWRDL